MKDEDPWLLTCSLKVVCLFSFPVHFEHGDFKDTCANRTFSELNRNIFLPLCSVVTVVTDLSLALQYC